MARGRNEILRPSVLDRLIAPTDGPRRGSIGIGFRELRAAVARDLEWLLNTRVVVLDEWRELEEVQRSLLTYGVPDFSTASWTSNDDRRDVAHSIEDAIRRFEPRLIARTVRVEVLPQHDVDEFRLRFRITAELFVDPIKEHVMFDTDIDLEHGGIEVSEAL